MFVKRKFMVLRASFLFEIHIQQRQYLTGETLSVVLLEERKLIQNNKEISIMAV